MKIRPTTHDEYIVAFLNLIQRCFVQLAHNDFNFDSLEFDSHDLNVIEYYMKDISRERVSEHTPQNECKEAFIEKLQLISMGETPTQLEIEELFRQARNLLTTEEVIQLGNLTHRFYGRIMTAS